MEAQSSVSASDAQATRAAQAGLTLSFDAQARAVLARAQPPAGAVAIDERFVHDSLVAAGYAELRPLPGAIASLVARYNAGQTVDTLRIAECVDGRWQIDIAPDRLSAMLSIDPAQGGRPVSEQDVLDGLAAQGIVEGVLHGEIQQAVASGEIEHRVIACGRPPVDGRDGWLESKVPLSRSRAPQLTETGRVDFRELGAIITVHPGEVLMQLHLPTEGMDGLSVCGEVLPAKPGRQVSFASRLPGTRLDPANPHRLLATIVGQPVEVKNGLMVEPVHAVGAVNMSTGNIHFEGSVVVKGDVAAGMTIQASGDIEIGGTAEPCTLEAGGSIAVKGGVLGSQGRKDIVESVIRCGGNFSAAYAQQAHVEAGDSIFIDDVAMQCNLHAGKHIRVGNKRRGLVIGGHLLAGLSITGKVLGSPNRNATLLEIGVSPGTQRRIAELAQIRDAHAKQLLDIGKLMHFAELHPERVAPDMLERARSTAQMHMEEIGSLREEEGQLQALAEMAQHARVNASLRVYEGVVVKMGALQYKVTSELGPASFGITVSGLAPMPYEARPAGGGNEQQQHLAQ